MTKLPVRRQPRSWLPDWSDLWTDFPSWAGSRPQSRAGIAAPVITSDASRSRWASSFGPSARLTAPTGNGADSEGRSAAASSAST